MRYTHNISPKHGSTLNTHSNDFIRRFIECMTSHKRKKMLRDTVRGYGGVAGKDKLVGIQRFHSLGKFTMLSTNINSDWTSNASSVLCINLFILRESFKLHLWGVTFV